ncbi:MAG: AAA family ATPase, partial [Alphaproteobacteria bacterium]|nr:AAA family ATPase [Alphaproteobacteria bacterium]
MLLKASQRGGAKQLANHILRSEENEHVEVYDVRGCTSDNPNIAFQEMYALSRGTECRQFMFSLSLNPPLNEDVPPEYFENALASIEKEMGLENQPRVVVFHEKEGRRHAHCVWSRIDIQEMKAINLPFYKNKLNEISKQLYLEHGWELPKGYIDRQYSNPTNFTLEEWQQAKRAKEDPQVLKALFKQSWEISDNKQAFAQALREYGFMIARGDRRGYVAVDYKGEVYSLSRWTGVKTKELQQKLGDPEKLPSISEAKQAIYKRLPTAIKEQIGELNEQIEPKSKAIKKKTSAELLDLITNKHAAFNRRMMEREVYRCFASHSDMRVAINTVLNSDKLIKIGERNGQVFYTTQEMLDTEKNMIALTQFMTVKSTHKIRKDHIQNAIDKFNVKLTGKTNATEKLSDKQISAIHHITQDKQLSLLVGVAGAGKSTIMTVVKESFETEGYRVRGTALSGIAASGLQDCGIQSSTLHSLEMRIETAQKIIDQNIGRPLTQKQSNFVNDAMLSSKDVLIIDEAGMICAKQLNRIIDIAHKSGAKIILTGDHEQLQSIEAGAAFRTILERSNFVELKEVRRQKEQWMKDATSLFSQAKTADALTIYQKNNYIFHEDSENSAKAKLVSDYMKSYSLSSEKSRIVLAFTRKDVANLNKEIKRQMIQRGFVVEKNIQVPTILKDSDGEYEETQNFSIGDRIMFRENNKILGVMNGTLATIRNIKNNHFYVDLDNGKKIKFSINEYRKFQLGYAATVHKSQGVTVDESYVLASKYFNKHTTYVAMTRHKDNVKLYASREVFRTINRLKFSLSKEESNISTLDFTKSVKNNERIEKHKNPLLRKKQALIKYHREAREYLAKTQEKRWQEEMITCSNRLSQNFKGLWQRITGKYHQIREQNEHE